MPQSDNSTLPRKVMLRQQMLAFLRRMPDAGPPVVLEAYGGYGAIWQRCYRDLPQGCVFEQQRHKGDVLCAQRPTWAVYVGDCAPALHAGAGAHLPVNVLDLDPYGDPWPALDAFCTSERPRPPVLAIAVHDGLLQYIRRFNGGAHSSLAAWVPRYGAEGLADHYLEACQEQLRTTVAQAGYRLSHWAGMYGRRTTTAHYLAVCVRA